jgi:hypothetical protein
MSTLTDSKVRSLGLTVGYRVLEAIFVVYDVNYEASKGPVAASVIFQKEVHYVIVQISSTFMEREPMRLASLCSVLHGTPQRSP